MLTVKFKNSNNGCVSVDGYPLHEIDVVYSLTAGGACGTSQTAIQQVTKVWVDNRAATIDEANAAGYTIYEQGDCTQCASAGYYGHHSQVAGYNPSTIYLWNFKDDCQWEGEISCGSRRIEVVYATKKANVCNDTGQTAFVYIDSYNFSDATGVFENPSAQDMNYLVQAQICDDETDMSCSSFYWFKHKDNSQSPIKRLNGPTNEFVETDTCSIDPIETNRYQHSVYYSVEERDICLNQSTATVWTDDQSFANSTTMWTTETGSQRPSNGYYRWALSEFGGSSPYYLFTSPAYILDTANPTGSCTGEGDDDGLEDDFMN